MALGRQLLIAQPLKSHEIKSEENNNLKSSQSCSVKRYILEERYNLLGEGLGCSETLRVEHDLRDELAVRLGHGQTTEELLQVVRQVGAAGVARVHGDEDGHVGAHLHLLVQQLRGDGYAWESDK